MRVICRLIVLLLASASVAVGGPAAAYPERAVTLICPFPAGGAMDIVARNLVEAMKRHFPKPVAVVNRPGAAGTIGNSEVVQAKPDGYTIGISAVAVLTVQPHRTELPYKTPDDYEPFMNLAAFYPLLVTREENPWKTAQEFLGAAKASPGKLRVGSPGEATSSHLNLEELMGKADIKVTHVPFSGWGEGSPALLGGHVEALVAQPGEVRPHVEARRLRILGVFQPARNPYFPDVPTWKELGYQVHNGVSFLVVVSKATPPDVVRYLHDATRAAMDEASFTNFAKARVIELDYRAGDKLRADLWQEFRNHTEILKRIGMIKK